MERIENVAGNVVVNVIENADEDGNRVEVGNGDFG